jgi:hypothetical protein
LAVGFALGILYYRWVNPPTPDSTPATVVTPPQPQEAAPDLPAIHSHKIQHKPISKDKAAQ